MTQVNDLPARAFLARCPYLGLYDDPATSLAYPSKWNYCYRVEPAAPVSLPHQSEVCLGAGFARCPVYQRETGNHFPPELRGTSLSRSEIRRPGRRRIRSSIMLLFLVAGIAALLLAVVRSGGLGALFPVNANAAFSATAASAAEATFTATVDLIWTNPALVIPTQPSRTPTVNLTTSPATPTYTRTLTFTPSRTPTRTPTVTPSRTPTRTPSFTPTPTRTRTPTATASPTRTPSPSPNPSKSRTPTADRTPSPTFTLPPSARVCGNALDVPFGNDTQFLVHRVQSGDTLDLYAATYHTTTDAIFAVNYRLPTPIWTDWIIVIPYNTSDVAGIPAFETYQAVWAVYSLEQIAAQLNADPQELSRYNALDGPCTIFSGWLIVPRKSASS